MDDIYFWQGGTSSALGLATNWFDITGGVTAVNPPGDGDTALLSGYGTVTGMAGGLGLFIVSATSGGGFVMAAAEVSASATEVGGALTLTSGSGLATNILGVNGGILEVQSGSTVVDGGEHVLEVSISGTTAGWASSLLQVDSGASVDTGGGSVVVGEGSGQAGTLLVKGGMLDCGLTGQLIVGAQGGTGSLTVSGTAYVKVSDGLSLGAAGQGFFALGVGAQLEAGNAQGGPALDVGVGAFDTARAATGSLTSLGGTIIVHGDTLIGNGAQGSMAVGGGTLHTEGLTLGVGQQGSGTLSIGANEVWADSVNVDIGAAGRGTLLMTAYGPGLGSVTLNSLSLGTAGGGGDLEITHERLSMRGVTLLGSGGSTASVSSNHIVVGSGGLWLGAGQSVLLGAVGANSTNTFDVSGSGAFFDATTLFGFAGSQIVFGAGARGGVGDHATTGTFGTSGGTITMAGATLNASAPVLVGAAGTLSVFEASSLNASAGLLVTDTHSTVVLDDGNINVTSASATSVLVSYGATLALSGGLLTSAGAVAIGSGFGSEKLSFASVTGSTSHMFVESSLTIAPSGSGELEVSSGGSVTASSVSVGGNGTTHGSLVLAGAGDALSTGLLRVGSSGTVTLGAGSHLSAGGLILASSTQSTLTSTSPTLAIQGGKLSVFGGAIIQGAVVLSQGGMLAVSNGLTLAAASMIIGQGTLSAGNIADLGRIGCNTGTMTCLGPVNGSGLLSVANGDVVLQRGEASTVGLVFGTNGTFTTAAVNMISGAVTGWNTGDAFDFTDGQVKNISFSEHTLTLFDGLGNVLGHETFVGDFSNSNFTLSSDHGAGTMICYHV